ncbi:MAG: hypothetical protein F4Z44_01295 [Gemmatimonadetes bacterium]|nr:hypothetical protein [Gemmatimonadota bacterium]MXX73694.1 hypothetical protein [Gemmatimonadota bacterium]
MMSDSYGSQLPVPAGRGVVIRDFIVFQIKLAADGLKDVVAINLSIIAIVIDLLTGRGSRPRFFYGVVRLSARFEGWLDLHRLRGIPSSDDRDPLSRLEAPDADALIDQFEGLVQRKTSEMRARREEDPWDSMG